MILYLVRHPQTLGNVEKRFYGHMDLGLTSQGELQIDSFIEKFQDRIPQKIYASPLKRAAILAEAFANQVEKPVEYDERLKEICFGIFENRTAQEIEKQYPKEWELFINSEAGTYPFVEGEHPKDFVERIRAFSVEKLEEKQDQMWITHSGVIRILLCILLEIPFSSQWHFVIGNCGLVKLEIQDGYAKLLGIDNSVEDVHDEKI